MDWVRPVGGTRGCRGRAGVNRGGCASGGGGTQPTPPKIDIAFYTKRDGKFEIYVMNADGSGQTRLTNNPASDAGPNWSPSR